MALLSFAEDFSRFTVDTGEVSIHLAHAGEGEPLLLLHGYPQTHWIWHRVAPDVAAWPRGPSGASPMPYGALGP